MDDSHEARETLLKLEERLRRDVRDMLEVLRADVPVFFRRAVKQAFEESPAADALDDAALRRLKADADRRADEVARELAARLERFEGWLERPAQLPPREPKTLDEHPVVGPALREVGATLRALLVEHGLTPRDAGAGPMPSAAPDDPASSLRRTHHTDERLSYRLPTYFVAGHYMKSLVESFWQSLALHHQLATELAAGAQDEQRQARRARWDRV